MLSLRRIPPKNMKAHPVRTLILMLLTFAQAICLFFGIMAVQGMRQELKKSEARLGADLLVYPTAAISKISMKTLLMQGTPVEVYRNRSMLQRMDSCEGIAEVSYQVYLSDRTDDGTKQWIVGFEPETDFVLSPWFSEGSVSNLMTGSVAVGSAVAVSAENTVTLYQKSWPVAARLDATGSELDEMVYVTMDTLRGLIAAAGEAGNDSYASVNPKAQFSVVLVRVENREELESITNWINIYVRKVTAVRSEETLTYAASGIRSMTGILPVIAVCAWLVLLLALWIVQSMLMKERRKELFVWHGIGASDRLVNRLMRREAFLTHIPGAAAGIVMASFLFAGFESRLLSGVSLSASAWILSAVLTLLLTVLTGLAATRLSVRKALKTMDGQTPLTL